MNNLHPTRRQVVAGLAASAASLLPAVSRAATYDTGASDREIKIGNTAAYSGPISQFGALGTAMSAYFKFVNDNGGINGRQIRFVSVDDAYSPPKTVEQTRKLVEEEGVLFLAGSVGTPTQVAVQKYLNGRRMPQLFLLGGSSRWGQPSEYPWTMGWSPTYLAEAAVYGKHILQTVAEPRIGIMYTNDDFGRDYFEGLKRGLGDKARLIVAEVTTAATDPTVDSQVLQLRAAGVNAFVNAGAGKGAVQAVRKASELGWKPAHYLNSNSAGIESFLKPIGVEHAVGVFTANYRKDPADPVWANDVGVIEWKNWMTKYNPGVSLANELYTQGYSVAQSVVQVIRQAGDNLTRANIMKQAASLKGVQLPLLVPGVQLNTSDTDFFPMQTMRLSRF
ncbi:MAG: ABC transporter substrate-binding protein, partial [Pseudomonadota bacterium]